MSSVSFCAECNNMLYPREDRKERQLLFACRNCDYFEPATNVCVYRHEILHFQNEATFIVQDLSQDPTLPRNLKPCPKCGYNESVYFQTRSQNKDARMTLYYVCCNMSCGYKWVLDKTGAVYGA